LVSPLQLGLVHGGEIDQVVWFKLDSNEFVVKMVGEDLQIPDLGPDQFELWYFAPVWNMEGTVVFLGLLGERSKIVPVSNERISSWTVDNKDFLVNLKVVPHFNSLVGNYIALCCLFLGSAQ
jgi:hypothetical protein